MSKYVILFLLLFGYIAQCQIIDTKAKKTKRVKKNSISKVDTVSMPSNILHYTSLIDHVQFRVFSAIYEKLDATTTTSGKWDIGYGFGVFTGVPIYWDNGITAYFTFSQQGFDRLFFDIGYTKHFYPKEGISPLLEFQDVRTLKEDGAYHNQFYFNFGYKWLPDLTAGENTSYTLSSIIALDFNTTNRSFAIIPFNAYKEIDFKDHNVIWRGVYLIVAYVFKTTRFTIGHSW